MAIELVAKIIQINGNLEKFASVEIEVPSRRLIRSEQNSFRQNQDIDSSVKQRRR